MGKVKISYDEAVKQGLTKECSECHKVKSVSEFYRNKKGKYGTESICKKCKAKYDKQYRQEHKEDVNNSYDEAVKLGLTKECSKCHEIKSVIEFSRQKRGKYGAVSRCKKCEAKYRQEHREEIGEYNKQYYQTPQGKESQRKYKRKYSQTPQGKENNRKGQRKYRQTPQGKEESRKRCKKYLQTPKGKENNRKRSQKRRALKNQSFYQPFSKQDEEFCLSFFNHTCPYSGKPLIDSEIHLDHIVALSDKDGVGATAPWNLIVCDSFTNISKKNKPVLEFINSLPNSDEVYNRIRGYIILQAKKYIDIISKDDITLKVFNITFDELKEAV